MMAFNVFLKLSDVTQPLKLTDLQARDAREGSQLATRAISAYRADNPKAGLDWAELRGEDTWTVYASWRL